MKERIWLVRGVFVESHRVVLWDYKTCCATDINLTAGVSRASDVESSIMGSGDEGVASKLASKLAREDDWRSVRIQKEMRWPPCSRSDKPQRKKKGLDSGDETVLRRDKRRILCDVQINFAQLQRPPSRKGMLAEFSKKIPLLLIS